MRVGLIAEGFGMESLKHVFQELEQTLALRHEVVHRPLEYFYASPRKQQELCEEFLLNCDVAIGRIDEEVLRYRERISKPPPLIGFLLGSMSRGAFNIAPLTGYLKSTDVLVGNCTGDIEIVRKFFKNAQARKLPFAFDETTFYPPGEDRRQAVRTEMGFGPEDKILLYSGRITLEKNLHTILKLFRVLQDLIPNLHLIVAGAVENAPFYDMGVYSVSIAGTVKKLTEQLGLNMERFHFIGQKTPQQLRDVYAAADLLVNMTLHHDENFGFAQVESMACGTPVIATAWGGLKDTIKPRETGYQISTVVTDSGVKINWWEAVNRIVELLEDDETYRAFRERCPTHAKAICSRDRYAETLESILSDCVEHNDGKREPLNPTEFAQQFWVKCEARSVAPPAFQRGPEAFALYKQLIAPFTGTNESVVAVEDALEPEHLLVLAAPVRLNGGTIQIDDPIFPFDVTPPEASRETCTAILENMQREPVIEFRRLESHIGSEVRNCLQITLKWLLDTGVLIRTRHMGVDPKLIGAQMSKPLFAIQGVDFTTDVIVIR